VAGASRQLALRTPRPLPATPGPPSAALPLSLIILSALIAELSGLRFTVQILELAGLASVDRALPLALRE